MDERTCEQMPTWRERTNQNYTKDKNSFAASFDPKFMCISSAGREIEREREKTAPLMGKVRPRIEMPSSGSLLETIFSIIF